MEIVLRVWSGWVGVRMCLEGCADRVHGRARQGVEEARRRLACGWKELSVAAKANTAQRDIGTLPL